MDEHADAYRQARADVITGIILFVIVAIGMASLATNPYIASFDYGTDPGPSLLPHLLFGLLILWAVALTAGGAVRMRRHKEHATVFFSRERMSTLAPPTLMLATLLVLTQVMTRLGFLVTAMIFCAVWTILIGVQEGESVSLRSVAKNLAKAAAIAGGVFIVFGTLIGVPLP